MKDAGFPWAAALTSLPVFTLVLCQFTYDWVICIIQREVPAYFRQFLTLDIEIVSFVSLIELSFLRVCTSIGGRHSMHSGRAVCLSVCQCVADAKWICRRFSSFTSATQKTGVATT